jgi:addiction module HigA family antidote
MKKKELAPVHPGEILQKEFLEPMGISQNQLAMALHVPARRINEIVLGKRGITADTALRLARYFRMSPQFWLGLQMDYELDVAEDAVEEQIRCEVEPMSATG